MDKPGPKPRPLADRFWEKVDKRGPGDCWDWMGCKNSGGYGQICNGKKNEGMVYAHRVSWEIHNGPIPEGQCVLHRYDNRSCVNPAHLFLGTNADNTHDMMKKDRANFKNTKNNVHRIRRLIKSGWPQKKIARLLGVDQTTISQINTGKTWAWLREE